MTGRHQKYGIARGRLVWAVSLIVLFYAAAVPLRAAQTSSPADPLRLVVMDPMALPLSCECVEGHAQRRYEKLALYLQEHLERPVRIAFTEDLAAIARVNDNPPDVVIGKQSVVAFDGVRLGLDIRPIARLTGKDGNTELRGLFVVRDSDPAEEISDLKGYRIRFGPASSREKHAAAIEALRNHGIAPPEMPEVDAACSLGAIAVAENEADAAVISDYAVPLLAGCGQVEKGELRVVGRTAPVPFVTAFLTDKVGPDVEGRIKEALFSVKKDAALCTALETGDGFMGTCSTSCGGDGGWPDFRGPGRDGLSRDVPDTLPDEPNYLWKKQLTGWGLAGVSVLGDYVIVADKDEAAEHDVWRCLDADTGDTIWTLRYPAAGDVDFTNSPRAAPVLCDGRAYLLGVFGHLRCVELETGRVMWKKHLADDLDGRRPAWGYSATPLLLGEKLIVNPGAEDGCLVALNRFTGTEIWRSPGAQTAYASPVLAETGGGRQIVTLDAVSLGGWDADTGERLWKIVPQFEGDFNVPTPLVWEGHVLAATENNGARLYRFQQDGRPQAEPIARFGDLAPDTTTPVIMDGLVLGCSTGKLFCLEARRNLNLMWEIQDDAFYDHDSLIAGNGRLLVLGVEGDLLLIDVSREAGEIISRLKAMEGDRVETWSHPALVGNRLYVRGRRSIVCLQLPEGK